VPLALWRILRALVHVLHGALLCALAFPFLSPDKQRHTVGWWWNGAPGVVSRGPHVPTRAVPHVRPTDLRRVRRPHRAGAR